MLPGLLTAEVEAGRPSLQSVPVFQSLFCGCWTDIVMFSAGLIGKTVSVATTLVTEPPPLLTIKM